MIGYRSFFCIVFMIMALVACSDDNKLFRTNYACSPTITTELVPPLRTINTISFASCQDPLIIEEAIEGEIINLYLIKAKKGEIYQVTMQMKKGIATPAFEGACKNEAINTIREKNIRMGQCEVLQTGELIISLSSQPDAEYNLAIQKLHLD